MKITLLLLIIFLSVELSFAQEVNYYDSGKIKDSLVLQENGLSEYFKFSENGNLFFHLKEVITTNGQIVGKLKEYFIGSNMLHYERTVNKSLQNVGPVTAYYQNGEIEYKGSYDQNQNQTGDWFEYYENGNLLRHSVYEDNKIIYRKDGLPNGNVYLEMELLEGKNLYRITYYHSNGNIESIRYENLEGDLIGKHIEYRENGTQLYKTGQYNDKGEKSGEWITYREDGTIWWSEKYLENGNIYCENFYENGKLKDRGERTYSGNKVGPWIYYDKDGNKINEENFGE